MGIFVLVGLLILAVAVPAGIIQARGGSLEGADLSPSAGAHPTVKHLGGSVS